MSTPESAAPVTLRDLARRLNISHSTASRALRNDPRISPPLRQKVQQLAREMGYRPNPMATGLNLWRSGKAKTTVSAALAWINRWPDPKTLRSYREFDLYWKGASEEAERAGYRLEEFVCNEQMPAARLQQILFARNVPGILIPPHGRISDWSDFRWDDVCVVRLGYSVQVPRAHIVTSDQLTDGLIAFQNAWRLGYRRIGMMTLRGQPATVRFVAGYYFGMLTQETHPIIPPLMVETSALISDGERELRRIDSWIKKHRLDAILEDGFNVPATLRKLGYRVPQDIGVASFSVLDGATNAGIYQNPEHIGRAAVQLLISLINHNELGIPEVCRELLVEGRWQDGRTLPRRRR